MADEVSDCSFTTNWAVIVGSLQRSIVVESSDSPIDDAVCSTSTDRRIVLRPRPSETCSCEIRINFTQRHEIHQVYVRSSARIYELYCTSHQKGNNDYLCTARCSLAAQTVKSACKKGDDNENSELFKGMTKRKSGDLNGHSDDDWVEVQEPESSQGGEKNDQSPDPELRADIQDLYEATAEIAHANPCTSLTIRLLSLQSKECAYIDKIYVFVEPISIQSSMDIVGNPSGNALISTLFPAMLQMCKASRDKMSLEKASSSKSEKHENKNLVSSKVSDTKECKCIQSSDIEKTLNLLVLRVSKMEEMFVRLEERMLSPLASIDARLKHVEDRLELLNKSPDLTSSKEFATPSVSNCLHGNNADYPEYGSACSRKEIQGGPISSASSRKSTSLIDDALASSLSALLNSTSTSASISETVNVLTQSNNNSSKGGLESVGECAKNSSVISCIASAEVCVTSSSGCRLDHVDDGGGGDVDRGDSHITVDEVNRESVDTFNKSRFLGEIYIPLHFLGENEAATKEVLEEDSGDLLQQHVLDAPDPLPPLDFETPVWVSPVGESSASQCLERDLLSGPDISVTRCSPLFCGTDDLILMMNDGESCNSHFNNHLFSNNYASDSLI